MPFEDYELLKLVFDTIPSMAFIVDHDVRIIASNKAAIEFIGGNPKVPIRGGELFNCVHHLQAVGGCGTGKDCKHCTLRNAVEDSVKGNKVSRRKAPVMIRTPDGSITTVHFLVSASPFELRNHNVLVILENVTEIIELQELVPICSGCKKIRDDRGYWERVEHYMSRHLNVEFTHGLCSECVEKFYKDMPPKE